MGCMTPWWRGSNRQLAKLVSLGATAVEEDGEPFEAKMRRLMGALLAQMEEGRRLDAAIVSNLRELGYGG